jgi:hypothetical protein
LEVEEINAVYAALILRAKTLLLRLKARRIDERGANIDW